MSQDRKLEEALSSAFSGLTIGNPHHTVLRSGAAYPKPIPQHPHYLLQRSSPQTFHQSLPRLLPLPRQNSTKVPQP